MPMFVDQLHTVEVVAVGGYSEALQAFEVDVIVPRGGIQYGARVGSLDGRTWRLVKDFGRSTTECPDKTVRRTAMAGDVPPDVGLVTFELA